MLTKALAETMVAASTFDEALAMSDRFSTAWNDASKALNDFIDAQGPRGPMNLTPDHVRAMPEYKALRAASDRAGEQSKIFAAAFTKRFKKEYRAYIIAQREAKLKASMEKAQHGTNAG